jgi:nucleoside-diphosphate-sugar epimerase
MCSSKPRYPFEVFSVDDQLQTIACVTGATGMIGGKIVPRLLDLGYKVRVLSRSENFKIPQVEWFCGGLQDEEVLKNFLQNAKLLFHCAAELTDQLKMWAVNVVGTERLFNLASQAGIEFLCHLSSSDVVGRTEKIWVDESTPCHPQNLYAQTKLEAEKLAAGLGSSCRVIILRPVSVVDHRKPKFLSSPGRASLVDWLMISLKGGEGAHLVHAEDVAAAAVFFITYPLDAPQYFFVSYDHEPMSTNAGLWALYSACQNHRSLEGLKPVPHLPIIFPHLLRRLCGRGRNRGNVRYSPQRLLATGFSFPLGLMGAVQQVIKGQGDTAS